MLFAFGSSLRATLAGRSPVILRDHPVVGGSVDKLPAFFGDDHGIFNPAAAVLGKVECFVNQVRSQEVRKFRR